jgi:hypothetical protein
MNCIHGIDSRFCANCNRTAKPKSRSAVGGPALEEILRFLNQEQVRATYAAVAKVLGVPPRSMGAALGHRRAEASWVVDAKKGLPTDYSPDECHPALLSQADIIVNGRSLELRMSKWRGSSKAEPVG